jgi:signal transduction histidine kinase
MDNGSGIAAPDREIIFEKFSRLSDTASAGAAGLGLAICREIMRNLGGGIRYVATPDGGVFRVSLDLQPAKTG